VANFCPEESTAVFSVSSCSKRVRFDAWKLAEDGGQKNGRSDSSALRFLSGYSCPQITPMDTDRIRRSSLAVVFILHLAGRNMGAEKWR
jgi:hypothetical protein